MSRHNRLTSKGQVTIPKDVRDALGLKPGEAVAFEKNEGGEYVSAKSHWTPRSVSGAWTRRLPRSTKPVGNIRWTRWV